MIYTHLLLTSFAVSAYSCSSVEDLREEETQAFNFNSLNFDTYNYIGEFVGDQVLMGHISQNSYKAFHENTNLKRSVEQTFGITGLEDVNDNEPELVGLLNLTWISHDPYQFFAALVENITSGKKPYKALFRPLIKYLSRTFQTLSAQRQREYQNYVIPRFVLSFEGHLANICSKNGHFDLVFELLDTGKELRILMSGYEHRDVLLDFFKTNPQFALQLSNSFTVNEFEYIDKLKIFSKWISECIIYDIPEGSFIGLLDCNVMIFIFLLEDLFLSPNIPESEYPRIHDQMSGYFIKYGEIEDLKSIQMFKYLKFINELRFGSLGLELFDGFDNNDETVSTIAKAALLGNKPSFFLLIYERFKRNIGIMEKIFNIPNLDVDSLQAKNFKIIFKILNDNDRMLSSYSVSSIVGFVTKFYAINNLGINCTLKFHIVSEKLLEYGFPPGIDVTIGKRDIHYNGFLSDMNMSNENIAISIVSDLIKCRKISKKVKVSFEFVELMSNSPNLMNLFLRNGMKLTMMDIDTIILEKYFNLPNFDMTSQILDFKKVNYLLKLTKFKTIDHLRKMEIIQRKSVGECFLNWERNEIRLLNDCGKAQIFYMEWRLVFAYWIKKSQDKERIREIRTPGIIQMLRLEFPEETRELLGP